MKSDLKLLASIVAYLLDEDNLEMIKRLKSAGISFSSGSESAPSGNSLSGKNNSNIRSLFGTQRDEYKDMIERNGGKNSASVFRKYFIYYCRREYGQSKKRKLIRLGVPMISESEFLKIIGKE